MKGMKSRGIRPSCERVYIRQMRTILLCGAVVACGAGSKNQPARTPETPSIHIALANLTMKQGDGGKLTLAYELTPKKVYTGEALLVRAACTKGQVVVRDTATWPIQENTTEPKAYELPFSDATAGATACQLDVQIVADLTTSSGTHEMTACRSAGQVVRGACSPAITETYAQGIASLCALDKWVRWDSKGADRDVDLKKAVDDWVWNQQAKEYFSELVKKPEAERIAPLMAEAKKQGVASCALPTFWSKPE